MITLLLFLSCSPEPFSSCDPSTQVLQDEFPFPVGVAANPLALETNPPYQEIINTQFNSITPENIFKPVYLQPEEGRFDWTEADKLVDYCEVNGKRLHAHTLIWYQQLPYWMENFQGSPEAWEQMMKSHIQTVVRHFKGKVTSWDVVNEAFEDDGSLRENIWLQHIGESYIEKAFRFAHEADSTVLLFYNDYSIAGKRKKRNAILAFLNEIRAKGVRVDGIGMQMHIGYNYPGNAAISKAITNIWENDFLLHLSELDISINPGGRDMPEPDSARLARQAEKYAFVFNTYQEVPADFQHGITIWGVSDAQSWIPSFFGRDDYPLLFNEDFLPKPAFCNLLIQ